MLHRDEICLQKIISEIDICEELLAGANLDEFIENEMLKRAVSMTVINVGELIKNITDDVRESNPEIPWKAIAGLRDVTAHRYQTLRMEDVFIFAKEDFPILKQKLKIILRA